MLQKLLFRILLSNKLPILIIKLILFSYMPQSVCVMWDSCKSEKCITV